MDTENILLYAGLIYVTLICPGLLFAQALISSGRTREMVWVSVLLVCGIMPISAALLTLPFFWAKNLDPALITLPLLALAPGLIYWRSPSRLMRAVRLQRVFIAIGIIGAAYWAYTSKDNWSGLGVFLLLTYANIITLAILAVAWGLRRLIMRRALRKRKARVLIAMRRLTPKIISALYLIGIVVALALAVQQEKWDIESMENERETLGQTIQQAPQGKIYGICHKELNTEELARLKKLFIGLQRDPSTAPFGQPTKKTSFSFSIPTDKPDTHITHSLPLAYISPAGSGHHTPYTLPVEAYEELLDWLHELGDPRIREATQGSIFSKAQKRDLSEEELAELKDIFAEIEWDVHGDFQSDFPQGDYCFLDFKRGKEKLASVQMVAVSAIGSGQETPYRLPEAAYRRLCEWVQQKK